MKLFKLSLIIQIIKNPQIPKLNYENLEKLKKYNERFLTFWELGCLDDVGFCNFWFGYIYKSKGGLTSELTSLIYIHIYIYIYISDNVQFQKKLQFFTYF